MRRTRKLEIAGFNILSKAHLKACLDQFPRACPWYIFRTLNLLQGHCAPVGIVRKSDPLQRPHKCPAGYSQHLAGVDQGCEINYCAKANSSILEITEYHSAEFDEGFSSASKCKPQ